MRRRIYKLFMLIGALSLAISACNPSKMLEPAIATMVSEAVGEATQSSRPAESTPQVVSGLDGFGMGSATYLRTKDIETQYREMAALGIKYIREEIPWAEAQARPGSLNLDYRNGDLARALDLAERYGLQFVALLAYSPGFEVSNKAEFLNYWSSFVEALVARFGNQIDHWEIGNEMNTWWGKVRPGKAFEADWYMGMLAEAHRIIKAADPNDTVIVGGLVNTDSRSQGLDPFETLRLLAGLNVETYADVLALHLYWPNQLPEEPKATLAYGETVQLNMPDYVREFIAQSQRHLGRDLPIWVTETGVDLHALQGLAAKLSVETEHLQAVGLARTYLHLLSIPEVRAVFWYTWLNDSTGQSFAMNAKSKEVLHTMTQALAGGQALGRVSVLDAAGSEESRAWDYRFKRANGEILSYHWVSDQSLDTGDARLVPEGQASVKVYNPDQLLQDRPREIAPGESFNLVSVPGLMMGPLGQGQQIQIGAPAAPVQQRYPLAYTKEGNIWVYYPDTGEKQQITSDGSPLGSGGTVRYQDPKISTRGDWVAFMSRDIFIVYQLESGQYKTIPIHSDPEMVGDTLLGWDEDNYLYYTRTVGPCDITKSPMQGPDATEVYRYDPRSEASTLVYSMPSSEEAGHAYWIGTDISSRGRYVSFSSAACNIGGIFTTYIVDTKTGKQYHGSYGLSTVSHDEGMWAYNDNSFYLHRGFVHPMSRSFTSDDGDLMHVAAASMAWDQPNWSYDDRYVSFNASSIKDTGGLPYDINMGGAAEYMGLTIYDRLADQPPITMGAGPYDGSAYFQAWSPYNYDIAMVRYPNGFNPKYPSELWIYPKGSDEGLLVDSGLGITEADW